MPCNCSSRDIDFVLKMQKKACQASLCITPSKGLSNEVPGTLFHRAHDLCDKRISCVQDKYHMLLCWSDHRETVLCTPKKLKTNLNVTLKVLIATFFDNLGLEGSQLVAQQVNVSA